MRNKSFPEVLLDKVVAFTPQEGGPFEKFTGEELPKRWHSLFLKGGRIWDSSCATGWFPEYTWCNKATVLRDLKEGGFV